MLTQYNISASSFFHGIVLWGKIGGVVERGNVRRGMKYPEGNDPSWTDKQVKMLIMPSNLLNTTKLSRRFMCQTFLPLPSEKAMKMSASFPNPSDGCL